MVTGADAAVLPGRRTLVLIHACCGGMNIVDVIKLYSRLVCRALVADLFCVDARLHAFTWQS